MGTEDCQVNVHEHGPTLPLVAVGDNRIGKDRTNELEAEPRQKGGKTSKLSIHEERTVTIAAPPQGSRFKGYTNFVVQDLVIRSHVVNFRRERWQKPDGDMMTAPLPAGISGHFGPELRRFVLAQYHQGQVTVPRLLAQLRAFGNRHLQAAARASADSRPGRLLGGEPRGCCAPGSRAPPGSRSTIPVLATRPRMASARRSATHTLPGLAPRLRRAASISSTCYVPATAITSSIPRRWITCVNARCPPR